MEETLIVNNVQIVQICGGRKAVHRLDGERIHIGRATENDVVLDQDSFTSRHHAVITKVADVYCLRDLGSSNGTLLNGEAFTGMVVLNQNDEILIGRTKLLFRLDNFAIKAKSAMCWKGQTLAWSIH